ncbi:hypothetical protein WAI453_004916 [Rhynchosporium graminicola]
MRACDHKTIIYSFNRAFLTELRSPIEQDEERSCESRGPSTAQIYTPIYPFVNFLYILRTPYDISICRSLRTQSLLSSLSRSTFSLSYVHVVDELRIKKFPNDADVVSDKHEGFTRRRNEKPAVALATGNWQLLLQIRL